MNRSLEINCHINRYVHYVTNITSLWKWCAYEIVNRKQLVRNRLLSFSLLTTTESAQTGATVAERRAAIETGPESAS